MLTGLINGYWIFNNRYRPHTRKIISKKIKTFLKKKRAFKNQTPHNFQTIFWKRHCLKYSMPQKRIICISVKTGISRKKWKHFISNKFTSFNKRYKENHLLLMLSLRAASKSMES